MYVTEIGNRRVQVRDASGHFVREFGQEGEQKLLGPSGLQVADKYVYVSDYHSHCVCVYTTSGQFVTSFGNREGEFLCIASCADGFIHVCDMFSNRVQIF